MICIISITSLVGCWDKVEIDQRGFVEIILIDTPPPGYEEEVGESVKGVPGTEKQTGKMIKVTYLFPNTSLLAGEGGGGEEPGFLSMSSIATSLSKTDRYIDARISRRLYFGHTQIIIFSEDILKDSEVMNGILDHFRRNPQFNRTMKMLVTDGEASKVGEIKPKGEKLMFRYIKGILQNEDTNGRIVDIDFNQFITILNHPEDVAMIPKVSVKDDELKISGVGVIKNFKLIGYLSEYDTLYFNTLRGWRRGGRESINVGDLSVDFATNNIQRRMKLINGDLENLEVGIQVTIEGTLVKGEFDEDLFDDNLIKEIEKGLNEMSEDSCKFVISKLQKEYNADLLEIADYLRKFYPDIWERVKGRWDEVYPGIKITPQIEHKIRRIGTAN